MATTTNYGWTTPDDTALVKDGASAIRTLGTAIDTTTFNNASAAIAKTIVDAKGDIIVATAADTVSRLAVGANDTVLVADSAQATGVKWATPSSGGMTLLSTTTLSGASTTVSSISQSYNSLFILAVNAASASSHYPVFSKTSTTWRSSNIYGGTAGSTSNGGIFTNSPNELTWTYSITIDNYTTTNPKPFTGSGFNDGPSSFLCGGGIDGAVALNSITFAPSTGTFSGGTVYIYGVK